MLALVLAFGVVWAGPKVPDAPDSPAPPGPPVEAVASPVTGGAVVRVRATGAPVAMPACRGVGWERFDEESGAFRAIPAAACGPAAPAVAVDATGTEARFEPAASGFQVVRAVVIVGVGCRSGQPFELAGCSEVTSFRSGPVVVHGRVAGE